MKSGGQIDEQMSSQSPVIWWYREVNSEVVRMSVLYWVLNPWISSSTDVI
jgi:hypothetical protein